MSTRAKQVLLVSVGVVGAFIMILLGLWQMQVFVDKGDRTVEARAEQPAVPLLDNINDDGTVGDVYGRQVTVSGHYLPDQELLVPGPDGTVRVLTAFQVVDGRVVPIVRGQTADRSRVAPAPAGTRTETGLFLPGEGENPEARVAAGEIESVRMPLLAQEWPQRLTPGYVTLDDRGASQYGLQRGVVTLPHGDGSMQNGGYALQWWIFAAFGLGMSIKFAQTLGKRERQAQEDAAQAALEASGQPSQQQKES